MKLTHESILTTCPTCQGAGKVPCPEIRTVRTGLVPVKAPGDGHPIPCPECKGKKVVAR